MNFKIKECKLYGTVRPFLFLNGWIERDVYKLEIVSNDLVLLEKEFSPTKSKIHIFDVKEGLKNCPIIAHCKIIAYTGNETVVLHEFRTSPLSRIYLKFKTKRNKACKVSLLGNHLPEYKATLRINNEKNYQYWIQHCENFHEVEEYSYNPLISIIMPVFNVSRKYLSLCIDSILSQTYQNFEICIADDCSTNQETIDTLIEYQHKDNRIKVHFRDKNGHISEASNSALCLAAGEFIGMMDNDDLLMPQALNEVVRALNDDRAIDFIYTDEDKVDLNEQRSDPQFKPDFTLDKLIGGNYICHFNVVRRAIMEKVGGFRKGFEGAQDFDLFLRITEVTNKFYHIPKILYHWRMIPGSTALNSGSKNYAGEAGKRALEEYFDRKNCNVQVSIVIHTHYYVEYILDADPKVNIIMKVTDVNDFDKKIVSIRENLIYKNFVFTFVTDDSTCYEKILTLINKPDSVVMVHHNLISTFNEILSKTSIEHILFLNENLNLQPFDAVDQFVGYNHQKEYGALGCKVLDQNNIIRDTGYFILNKKSIPLYYGTLYEDYGIYGTLLVPNAFRLIENKCFMVHRDKVRKINYFDDRLCEEDAYMDLFMRLHMRGYRNVHLPRIEAVMKNSNPDLYEISAAVLKKWEKDNIDLMNDPLYNQNVSKRISYRFEKKGDKDEKV